LSVFSDLANGIHEGNISTLALLELSAAFDTIDHSILLKRLEISFGIRKKALNWRLTYLSNRLQTVKTENTKSSAIPIKHGVPQGSVRGPLLFTLHISPLTEEIKAHNYSYHQCAGDTQLYTSTSALTFDDMTVD
jgi:retron-type reverse transcriptase